jgi:hypothetical protein
LPLKDLGLSADTILAKEIEGASAMQAEYIIDKLKLSPTKVTAFSSSLDPMVFAKSFQRERSCRQGKP